MSAYNADSSISCIGLTGSNSMEKCPLDRQPITGQHLVLIPLIPPLSLDLYISQSASSNRSRDLSRDLNCILSPAPFTKDEKKII